MAVIRSKNNKDSKEDTKSTKEDIKSNKETKEDAKKDNKESKKDSKDKKLTTSKKEMDIVVPVGIPKENFVLTKLDDGYRLEAQETRSHKDEKTSLTSSQSFSAERRYGKKVKSVKGEFTEEGRYNVDVTFE